MTRETKLGLVVSCTFLCLLGAVLYIKWNEPSGASHDTSTSLARADDVMTQVPADPKPDAATETPATPGGGDNSPRSAAPSEPSNTHHDPLITRASADTAPPSSDLEKKTEPAPLPPQPPSNTFSNDASPAPTFPAPGGDANPPRLDKDASPPGAQLPDSLRKDSKAELGTQSKDENRQEGAPAFPSAPAPAIGGADNAKPDLPAPAPAAGGAENAKPDLPVPSPSSALPAPTPPSGSGFTPAPLPRDTRPERSAAETTSDPRPAPLPFPPKPEPAPGASELVPGRAPGINPPTGDKTDHGFNEKPKDTATLPERPERSDNRTTNTSTPAMESGQLPRNGDSWNRPEPAPGIPPLGKPSPAASGPAPITPNPVMGAQNDHLPHRDSTGGTSADLSRTFPPLGSPTTGTSPPIAVPTPIRNIRSASATLPRVDSYDEQTHVCAQNDTFESISTKYYGTADLAGALMQFNHTHPRASTPLLQNPPTLVTGVAVYIPPARVLQNQLSPSGKTTNSSVPVATATPSKLPSEPAKPAGGAQYKVRRSDEMIPLIARDVLGSVDRWTEIYQLNNRNFDPSRPIPAGTILALPANAKVPPENVP